MHKDFGDWHRLVSIERTDEILKKRWDGVEEWVSAIRDDAAALLETVRIFRGLPEKTSREAFLEAFRKHDAAFAQRNNELEQRVLAGATLVHCVLTHDKGEDNDGLRAAALAGMALEASRLRAADGSLEELTGEALTCLHEIARQQRRRSGFDTTLLTTEEREALTKTLGTNVPDHNQLRAICATAFQTVLLAVDRSEEALEAAAHDIRCADEETNILWWLAGGSSRDLDKPWSELKDAVPLIAGWELADLTDVALGPQDAAALLERVIPNTKGKSKEQAFHVYVNAVPEDWAKNRGAKLDDRALDLTPLSFALSHRSKGNAKTWQVFFESVSGLKTSTTLAPQQAARLAYVEAVLFRTLSNVER